MSTALFRRDGTDEAPLRNDANARRSDADARIADSEPRRLDSRHLFAPGQNTVVIEHGGQHYQLRLTRENKLILTK